MSTQTMETRTPVLGDMGYDTTPANLTPSELLAYRKGFDRGARAHIKKNGSAAVAHTDGVAPAREVVADRARMVRIDRHPAAHKSGMTALRSYVRKYGDSARLAEIVDPLAPVKVTRKPAARKPRKLASVPDVVETVAPVVVSDVTVPAPMPRQTHAAKKASNRELAAAMRAAGIKITTDTWAAAKAGNLEGVSA